MNTLAMVIGYLVLAAWLILIAMGVLLVLVYRRRPVPIAEPAQGDPGDENDCAPESYMPQVRRRPWILRRAPSPAHPATLDALTGRGSS